MNRKNHIILIFVLVLIVVYTTSKYKEYQSNREYREKVTFAFLNDVNWKISNMTHSLKNMNGWGESTSSFRYILRELYSAIDICRVYMREFFIDEDYMNEIFFSLDNLHTALIDGLTLDGVIFKNKVSFKAFLDDGRISDNEKVMLTQILKDMDSIYANITSITGAEQRTLPSDDEIRQIFESLYKYDYDRNTWTVIITN